MRKSMLAMAFCLAAAQPLWANSRPLIEINDAWARPTLANAASGVVYLTIVSNAADDDAVTGVSTPVATMAQLHESMTDHGVMTMAPLANMPVPAHGTVAISPGGKHIMLMGLTRALKAGETFPLTMSFAKAGPIAVTVTVSMSDPGKAAR